MDCQRLEELLPTYVDGTLSALELARVEAHLGGCEGCRGLVEMLRLASQELHAPLDLEVPEGLAAKAFQAAMASGAPPQPFLDVLLGAAWKFLLGGVLVASASALLLWRLPAVSQTSASTTASASLSSYVLAEDVGVQFSLVDSGGAG